MLPAGCPGRSPSSRSARTALASSPVSGPPTTAWPPDCSSRSSGTRRTSRWNDGSYSTSGDWGRRNMTTHEQQTPLRGRQKGRLFTLAGGLALAAVYWFPVRHWFHRWGTTPEELERVMPGDALMPDPTKTDTGAITVNAPPEAIWPWLVQMGTGRGGLYSYDLLDRLFGFLDRPSATRILPEFQHLAVGDKVPWGRD